jgi:hypothetical protein
LEQSQGVSAHFKTGKFAMLPMWTNCIKLEGNDSEGDSTKYKINTPTEKGGGGEQSRNYLIAPHTWAATRFDPSFHMHIQSQILNEEKTIPAP